MATGPHSLDDEKIRTRCASPEAADYTLYVRGLVNGPDVRGGQAEILRMAADRGLLPTGYTRQTLSEHLSGRYRHGPPWGTTEMIIECLPDHAPKHRIRERSAALFRAASRAASRAARRSGSRPRNSADLAWPDASPTGARWERHPNSVPERHDGPDPQRPPNTPRLPGGVHFGGNALHLGPRPAGYRTGSPTDPASATGVASPSGAASLAGAASPTDPAAEIADLRAECARLTVALALARALAADRRADADPARYTDLSTAFAGYQRSRLGQLAEQIDPAAPLMRQALARYLCAYAELGQTPVNELAVRTTLSADAVAEVLTARRMPTDVELRRLGAVLGADGDMVRHLAAHARAEAGTRGTADGSAN